VSHPLSYPEYESGSFLKKNYGKYPPDNMASHKLFYPEDGGRKFLRNGGDNPPDCTRIYIN
jgi:hypothetical protein